MATLPAWAKSKVMPKSLPENPLVDKESGKEVSDKQMSDKQTSVESSDTGNLDGKRFRKKCKRRRSDEEQNEEKHGKASEKKLLDRATIERMIKERAAEAALTEKQLYVGPTRLPLQGEKGLFARVPIKSGTFLISYRGERCSKQEIQRRYGDEIAAYAAPTSDGSFIDAADPSVSSLARYANDLLPETLSYMCKMNMDTTGLRINAGFVQFGKDLYLRALVDINSGEEIFTNYGPEYWGSSIDQVRGAIIETLVDAFPNGFNSFELANKLVNRIQLIFGDPNLAWKRMTDAIDLALVSAFAINTNNNNNNNDVAPTNANEPPPFEVLGEVGSRTPDGLHDARIYRATLATFERQVSHRRRARLLLPKFYIYQQQKKTKHQTDIPSVVVSPLIASEQSAPSHLLMLPSSACKSNENEFDWTSFLV